MSAKEKLKKQGKKMVAKAAVKAAATVIAWLSPYILAILAILGVIALLAALILFWTVHEETAQAGACSAPGAGAGAALNLASVGITYIPNTAGYFGPNPTVVNIAYSVGKMRNVSDEVMLALFVAIDDETGFKNLGNDGQTHGPEDSGSKPADLAEAAKSATLPHDPWKSGSEFGTDHASAGILQQQVGPSFDWGTVNEVMDPAHAADVFVTRLTSGPSTQYAGNVPMMVQAVQRSGTTDGSNYAAVVPAATDLFNQAKAAWDAKQAAGPTTPAAGAATPRAGAGGNVPVSFDTARKGIVITNALLNTSTAQNLTLTPVQTAPTPTPAPAAGGGFDATKVASVDAIVAAAGISTEQATNAQIIAATALKLGYGQKGVLTAIVAALAESSLINVGHGDALGPDSIGLYQQMKGWIAPEKMSLYGTPQDPRTDPAGAATMFFEANNGPGSQGVHYAAPDWMNLEPWDIAQKVELSEFDGGGHSYSRPYAQNYKDQMELGTKITAAVLNDPTILINGVGSAPVNCPAAGTLTGNPNGDARAAAAVLVASPNIRWLQQATKDELTKFSTGGQVVNSCGNPMSMSPYLMNALATLTTNKYTLEIDDFGFPDDRDYCETGNYQHPKGNAVDIQYIENRTSGEKTSDGMDGYPGNDAKIASEFATDFLALLPAEADGTMAHGGIGQKQCGLNPTFPPNSVALDGAHLFEDSCDHLHVDVRNRLNLSEAAQP